MMHVPNIYYRTEFNGAGIEGLHPQRPRHVADNLQR